MKKNKRFLAAALAKLMLCVMLAGCGDSSSGSSDAGSSDVVEGVDNAEGGKVYYLNFKPEQDGQWQDLARLYSEQKGVEVVVITAASGQYETTLKSEMAKREAPTLFQVNGPVGLANWKD